MSYENPELEIGVPRILSILIDRAVRMTSRESSNSRGEEVQILQARGPGNTRVRQRDNVFLLESD